MELPATATELCLMPATEQRVLLRARQISAVELLEACLAQIDKVNPDVNAIVTIDPDGALRQAEAADASFAADADSKPLLGLVVAHKDLVATAGMRTTMGSPELANWIPDEDAGIVATIREAGAIRLGKTNVPQHGAGSHSFNPVFGVTRNPWNLDRSAGGSSGGAGAALATGMVSLADGSDLGGSLRNPGSFNSVVGFRNSLGTVSRHPVETGWVGQSTLGAMGRTVRDMALLHSVVAGYDSRDPNSVAIDTSEFLRIAEGEQAPSLRGVRIGWSDDLGGVPVESEVTRVLNEVGRNLLTSLGADVRSVDLDFDGAEFSFRTLRAWAMVQTHGETYRNNPESLSRNVMANVEMGLDITAADIHQAFTDRTRVTRRFAGLFGDLDLLAMPTVQVAPFPVEWNHPEVVAGEAQGDYLGWMRSCWYVTATGLPAISVPCGFTEDGLPVGIQLVGRPLGDAELVRYALAFEEANPVWKTHPKLAV